MVQSKFQWTVANVVQSKFQWNGRNLQGGRRTILERVLQQARSEHRSAIDIMAVWPAPPEPTEANVKPVATDNGVTTGDGKLHSWTDLSALTLPELRSVYTTQTKELNYKGKLPKAEPFLSGAGRAPNHKRQFVCKARA